jgi:hypothetical protein
MVTSSRGCQKLLQGPGAPRTVATGGNRKKSSCLSASIFADCFAGCIGAINGAAPGPVCGWNFIEPFGSLGGMFSFTPGIMSMDTAGDAQFPIAAKSLPASLSSVFGISGQFDFTEYLTAPNANTTYQIFLNNSDISEVLSVSLFGDGSLVVQAGEVNSVPTYVGTWMPTPGAAHVVHFSIDGLGVPTLWLDGVAITLTFFGNVGSFATSYPANSISYGGGAGVAVPAASPLRRLFITAGATAPGTEFCCP